MSDAVQQIKDKLNILDVISPYVELHKAGKNFKGKSPFSAEKTPSFYVSPDRGMYYCFSTSQGGDMFNFIQIMEGVEFKEALKILADKAGVELVPEDPKQKSVRERWLAALSDAASFYADTLTREREAMAYLEKRGVLADTIIKWQIGYAPGPPNHGWRELKEHLSVRGYTNDELLRTGLIKTSAGGKEPFDVFRDRIVFPMADPSGKVVAFSGRILHPDEKSPKYVNSPETDLYKKSDLLYGYDKAKHGIRHLNFSLIVEGQFDVVMSHQAGYSNAVAVSGTALTMHHVQLLERLSHRVVLALDADKAGIAAMKRAADLMLRRGLDVKVAELPDGKDPADLVLEGKDRFKSVVGKAVHVIEFLLHVVMRGAGDVRTKKLKAREEILPFILLLPSRIDQEHFVEIVAKEIGTTTDAVRFELERLREQGSNTTVHDSSESTEKGALTVSADSIQNALVFVVAASELLDAKAKMAIQAIIQNFYREYELAEPETPVIAATSFKLEQQFATLPVTAIQEEVLSRLNQLRTLLTKRSLASWRERLGQASEAEELTVLEKISEHTKQLRLPPFDTSIFSG